MTHTEKILVVDDDKAVLESIKDILSVWDYTVDIAPSGEDALTILRQKAYDLVITDLMTKGMDGIQLLKEIKNISPRTEVIVVTGYSAVSSAIDAIKAGAYDYVAKPFTDEEMILRIDRALKNNRDEQEKALLRNQIEEKYSLGNIISKNKRMMEIFDQVLEVAQTDVTVLVLGETGTGKELVAKAVHYNSHRKNAPFMAIHCAALTETLLESELFGHEKGAFTGAFKEKKGRFEQAEGGTIFLDEVGDIPIVTQVKLLRFLQEREFERVGGTETLKSDVRIITATNKNLEERIAQGLFREDFYYRLNVFPIKLPPLRERKEDIPILADYFIKKLSKKLNKKVDTLSEITLEKFFNFNWPGNIRELENILERSVLTAKGNVIQDVDLGSSPCACNFNKDGLGVEDYEEFKKKVLDPVEKDFFVQLINKYNGNIDQIVDKLKISKRTFYNRVKDYGISLP